MALSLAQLRAFVAVLDERSFSGAAEALRVSQPAVSGAVAALEREVGGAVVHRHDATATPLGERLLPHARAALEATDRLRAEVAAFAGRPVGLVRLGAVTSVIHGLLPRLMRHLAEHAPGVELEVLEGDDAELPGWLRSGAVDAAILIDDGVSRVGGELRAEPEFEGVALPGDEMRFVLRTDHPLANERAIALAELVDDPLLCGNGGCLVQAQRIHDQAGLPMRIAQRVNGLGALLSMVKVGTGVSIAPSYAAGLLPRGTVMVPIDPPCPRRLTLATASASPATRALAEVAAGMDSLTS